MASLAPASLQLLFPPPETAPKNRAARLAKTFWHASLDLLFPPHCAACGEPLPPEQNPALCLACVERIDWQGPDRCARCGAGLGPGVGVRGECPECRPHPPRFVAAACTVYKYGDGPARDLILALKFGRKLHVARVLGELLAQRIAACELLKDSGPWLVVPAPLARRSLVQRGFNQAEEIAAVVAARLKLKLETKLLRKIRATPPQATLSHDERRENLKGAFACAKKAAARRKGARVLLIDDVITTGATISECARTLHEAGIAEIRAAAVARTSF